MAGSGSDQRNDDMEQGVDDTGMKSAAIPPTEAEIARMRFRFKLSEPNFDGASGLRQRLSRSRLAVVFSHGVSDDWITQFLQQRGVVGGIERRKQHTYLISIPLNVRKRQWMKEISTHPSVRYVGRYW